MSLKESNNYFYFLYTYNMDKEQVAKAFASLTRDQRADVLMAIVCNITWRKMAWKKMYTEKWEELPFKEELVFTPEMVVVIMAILTQNK